MRCIDRGKRRGVFCSAGDGAAGCVSVLAGKAFDEIQTISAGITKYRSTGAILWIPFWLSHLGVAHAHLGKFDDAWRGIGEAMTAIEASKERWFKAEVNRIAGKIALKSPEPVCGESQIAFRASARGCARVAGKVKGLRAAMSMARLWRDQGKRDAARDILAPVYNWFTEGFDTFDLKEAKALFDRAFTPDDQFRNHPIFVAAHMSLPDP